ncbi:MAG: hypothetical protein WBK12_07320, partial [Tenuifilaceae bacterium]
MIKKVLYSLAIALVLMGAVVTATADKATPDSTALDSSVIIQNIQPTTGDAVDTAGAKPVNQLLTAKKAFKF